MKKSSFFFLIAALLLTEAASAQPFSNVWTRQGTGNHMEVPLGIAGDSSGNILVAGVYSSPFLKIGNDSLINAGGNALTDDAFITKYDGNGNPLWSKRAGGIYIDAARCISADAFGNVIVAGVFYSPSITFGSTILFRSGTSNSVPDIFLVKYDPAGNVLWAKKAGSSSVDYVNGLTTDASGNIYITGYFRGKNILFNSTVLNNSDIVYTDDAFLTKYDPSGNVLWAKKFGGTFYDQGNSIVCDASGSILLTGSFSGSFVAGTDTLTAVGRDVFLARYSPAGTLLWVRTAGGNGDDQGDRLCSDAGGNCILAGTYMGPEIYIGTDSLLNTQEYYEDIFLIAYDPTGNILWIKGAGGSGSDLVQGLSVTSSGKIAVAGSFGGPQLTVGNESIPNAGVSAEDAFLFLLEPDGNLQWISGSGTEGEEKYMGLSTDFNGRLLLTGYFTCSVFPFGPTALHNSGSAGSADYFVTQLDLLTGIEETSITTPELLLYPNPGSGVFTLLTKHSVSKLEVFDMLGKLLREEENEGEELIRLDISDQPEGIYFIRFYVEGQDRPITRKISVSR